MDAKRDKLDRRRSTKLTVPATFDGQFITLIVYLCLQHDAVARDHLRQPVLVVCTAAKSLTQA